MDVIIHIKENAPGTLSLKLMAYDWDDERDLVEFASTQVLNKSFEFISIDLKTPFKHAAEWYPSGPHIAVISDGLNSILQHYKFWTVDQLIAVSDAHRIASAYSSRKMAKNKILTSMSTHLCTDYCHELVYIFKTIRSDRRTVRHADKPIPAEKSDFKPKRVALKRKERVGMDVDVSEEIRTKDRDQHRERYESTAERNASIDQAARDTFPSVASKEMKRNIIEQWQDEMSFDKWKMRPCAVCSRRTPAKDILELHSQDIDLTLLQNQNLPNETLPTTYNLSAYEHAILNPDALHNKDIPQTMDACKSCVADLTIRHQQPKNSLANWHYSGFGELPIEVQNSFKESSMFDLMMVARCRATRITQLYSNKKGDANYKGDASESQRYDRGNVSVIPQDSVALRPLLPPDGDEIKTTMAALFTGSNQKPTFDNISKLSPVLVSKKRIRTILDFLLTRNMWYQNSGTVFSEANYNNLFSDKDADKEEAVPKAVDLCWLPPNNHGESEGGTADYTDRNEYSRDDSSSDVVMEAVGYTERDRTPQNYRIMRASALAWCLARKIH